jgi:uncharacterized protein YbjT (DUF2867 family)
VRIVVIGATGTIGQAVYSVQRVTGTQTGCVLAPAP